MNEHLNEHPMPSEARKYAEKLQTEAFGATLRVLLANRSIPILPTGTYKQYEVMWRRWHERYAVVLQRRCTEAQPIRRIHQQRNQEYVL